MKHRSLSVVLLESPLELVPREIQRHPQVLSYARRFGIRPEEALLDKTYHYYAMASLREKWKRGRPDIVHFSLLLLQDSLLNQRGLLRTYIHVRSGKVYYVEPETRLPKHYDRFKGLMAQLLMYDRLPPGSSKPLIYRTADGLEEFVERHGGLILLWEKGEPRPLETIVREALETGYPIGVGMFPRGDFSSRVVGLASRRYRLRVEGSLKAWSVLHYLLCEAERLLGIRL